MSELPPQEVREIVTNAVTQYRELLAAELGQQSYGGDRDYHRILGYKDNIQLRHYHERYRRQDIAARIVDLPGQDTWRRPPQLSEDDNADTEFVRAWERLAKERNVWGTLARLDKLSGIGHYGVLLLGLRDGRKLADPVNEGRLNEMGADGLVYLRPLPEINADITEWEQDPQSPRYGRPLMYQLTLSHGEGNDTTFPVHHSRVLHVADNKVTSEVYGVPRLQKVWNRLDDLQKLAGGSAEATWLNMRRGTAFTTREGFTLDSSTQAVDEREQMIKNYVHDIARTLILEGLEVTDLGSSTVDPRGAFEVTIALISAATNIPQRVLIGSAQGELAAAEQDTKIWYDFVSSRQVTWAEPEVLRPFIDRLVRFGILPSPGNDGYDVGTLDEEGRREWPSLWQVSEVERASIAMNRGQAVAAVRNPVTGSVPEWAFDHILGFAPKADTQEALPESEPQRERVTEPGPEPSANIEQALANYEAGEISATQLAQYAALELGETI